MSLKRKPRFRCVLLCGMVLIFSIGGCNDELIDGFAAGLEAGMNSGISSVVSGLITTASEDVLGIENDASSSGGTTP